jgi:hypothetical protein
VLRSWRGVPRMFNTARQCQFGDVMAFCLMLHWTCLTDMPDGCGLNTSSACRLADLRASSQATHTSAQSKARAAQQAWQPGNRRSKPVLNQSTGAPNTHACL